MPKNAPAAASAPPASYEAALAELEALVARMDSGQMPLEELLGGYQRGAALLAFCRERLAVLEHQIQQIDEAGAAKPWVAAA